MADVPLIVISDFATAERRVTPSWSIAQLKAKLEPVTGIPPSAQRLYLKAPGRSGGGESSSDKGLELTAPDEEVVQVGSFGLVSYAELHVSVSCSFLDSVTIHPSLRKTGELCDLRSTWMHTWCQSSYACFRWSAHCLRLVRPIRDWNETCWRQVPMDAPHMITSKRYCPVLGQGTPAGRPYCVLLWLVHVSAYHKLESDGSTNIAMISDTSLGRPKHSGTDGGRRSSHCHCAMSHNGRYHSDSTLERQTHANNGLDQCTLRIEICPVGVLQTGSSAHRIQAAPVSNITNFPHISLPPVRRTADHLMTAHLGRRHAPPFCAS